MVFAREEAVGCLGCRGDNGRLDWLVFGSGGDPMLAKEAAGGKK